MGKADELTNIVVNWKIIHGTINKYFLFTIPTVTKTSKTEFITVVVSSSTYQEISRHGYFMVPLFGHTAQYQFVEELSWLLRKSPDS